MINKLLSCVVVLIVLFNIMGGCRSAKKIQKAISIPAKDTAKIVAVVSSDPKADSMQFIQQVLGRVQGRHIDFKTFSAKIKVNYEGGDGKNYEFNASLHMLKDSMIWISANALLGIEALRILITPDSVKMRNNLEKIVQLRSVSYLQEVANIPLDFKTLQDLLIGNPVYLDSNVVFYRKEDKGLSLMSIGLLFKNYITLNRTDFTVQHSKLDDVDAMSARTCDLTYGDYEQKDTMRFSTYRKISVAEKSKLDIQISFKQYNFNEVLSFPFSVPKNYKRK